MKKSFGIRLLLVCLLLLTMLNASYAVADDVGADDRNPSNDIVIVLDQSNSMSNADPQNRRLDAAQMIVGMCDMENSRVAIIPFAGKIQASADMGFVPINEAESPAQQNERYFRPHQAGWRYRPGQRAQPGGQAPVGT